MDSYVFTRGCDEIIKNISIIVFSVVKSLNETRKNNFGMRSMKVILLMINFFIFLPCAILANEGKFLLIFLE